ncbi:MAG: endonuclease/exonuclease/phosphatase family protein [Gemmatimonadaceae bacterium]
MLTRGGMPAFFSSCRTRLICAGAVLGLSGCAINPPARETPRDLRVLVYNIHAGKDRAGVDNLQRTARMVLDSAADIALLQEVDSATERSGRTDQLAEIQRLTGFHGTFGGTLNYQGGAYGIAVISRFPIVKHSVIRLPVTPGQERAGGSYEPRGVLHATILVGRVTIDVLNTHLDASADDSYRRQEAATLVRITRKLTKRGARVLLGGDLNSTPESAIHAMLEETTGLRDAWPACGSGDGFSYPETKPTKRIDYLLISKSMRCTEARVLESGISDHRPVLFRVDLRTDH